MLTGLMVLVLSFNSANAADQSYETCSSRAISSLARRFESCNMFFDILPTEDGSPVGGTTCFNTKKRISNMLVVEVPNYLRDLSAEQIDTHPVAGPWINRAEAGVVVRSAGRPLCAGPDFFLVDVTELNP